ncbi:hypothetical protein Noca_1565 [Nocardioides sp. JS614]|nr:hypothetical protein Noca_1565 [Nocardioides sp. JS614]
MPSITQAGITPRELDDLVDGERWRAWCRARPELEAFDSLANIRRLRGAAEDQALGALLWLGAAEGGDDQLAAVAVLHQLGASIRIIARHFWYAADGEADGIVAGAMWEQIRAYDWRERTGRHAQAIHHATRKSVRSALLRDPSRWQTRGVIPLNPQSWLFEAVMERQIGAELQVTDLGPQDELQALLCWSLRTGVLGDDEVALLTELLDADRDNPRITKWMRGACSTLAVERAASARGVCAKSVTRARDRAIAKLRVAAPNFLDEVA